MTSIRSQPATFQLVSYQANQRTTQTERVLSSKEAGLATGGSEKDSADAVQISRQAQALYQASLLAKPDAAEAVATATAKENKGDELRGKILSQAKRWVGKIPYAQPGAGTVNLNKVTPKSMDCSGFTSSVYLTELNINIGRTTSDQIKRGSEVTKGKTPDETNLKIGDLIFFDWDEDKKVDHVAMYAGKDTNGNHLYIHEGGTGSSANVRIDKLDYIWSKNVMKIKRIIQDDGSLTN
ncbi:NlpC/P60 family protein [Geobacillus sp. FSL W8-0032]|uniref:NlpC/P60 domain-containing protein n=1 Tax=Geobacillus icigianus TaxID=1430331 RepID=A0ABU6BCJ5_9BACL|nr:NlpC/P60 family protein [Geobacillus icigianus]MEB3749621.1 hypothetical protein [Geobacillus icigianus]